MPSRLPQITGLELIRALHRGGWYLARHGRRHDLLRHPDKPGLVATIPRHASALPPGTLRAILNQIDMSADELRELL